MWVGPLDKEAASGLIRYSLTFAYVAKKMLRVEQVGFRLQLPFNRDSCNGLYDTLGNAHRAADNRKCCEIP